MAEIDLPKYNSKTEYQFIDVFEHLILIMIVRREVINYAIRKKRFDLLGAENKQTIQEQKIHSKVQEGFSLKNLMQMVKKPLSQFEKIKTIKLQKEKTEKAMRYSEAAIAEDALEEDKLDKGDELSDDDDNEEHIENIHFGTVSDGDEEKKAWDGDDEDNVVFEREGDSLDLDED